MCFYGTAIWLKDKSYVLALAGNQYMEARVPWVPECGYVLNISQQRFEELDDDLQGDSRCSQAVPKVPLSLRRKWMLCFIGTKRGYLTHVARSEVRYAAESGKDKLDIWNVLPLKQPVKISAIRAKLQGAQAWRARKALKGGHVSPAAFKLMLLALRAVDKEAAAVADGLVDLKPRTADPEPTASRINWAYQRDAIVTALEIAGIPKGQLAATPQLSDGTLTGAASIFDSDDDVTTIEDLAILQDLDVEDEGWALIKRQRYPAKTYANDETKLTIILANKLPLEHQLGVDLVYVNETLRSVVFVQYKMFRGADGEGGYRPDNQLTTEIKRMDAAAAKIAKVPVDKSCEGYRFAPDAFFLKFCKKLLTHEAVGHVPGFYVPISYWKRLATSPASKGPRGGTVIYPDTLGRRYFNPTSFIDLVARGWIGTSALQTDILVPYLQDALKGKKGLVLAVQTRQPSITA